MLKRIAASALLLAPLGAGEGTPEEEFAQRAAKLEGKPDAKAWLALADYAEEHLLRARRAEALAKALEAAPDLPEAHARLDEVRVGDAWMPADEAEAKEEAAKAEKGLVLYGKEWVPLKEAQGRLAKDAARWKPACRVDSPRFSVLSAHPLAQTRRLSAVLESLASAYVRFHEKLWKLDARMRPVKVWVFDDRAAWAAVLKPLAGAPPPEADGFYHPQSQTVYLFQGRDDPEARLVSAAVHECALALDDLMAHQFVDMPPWVASGRADLFALALHGRQVIPGLPRVHEGSGRLGRLQNGMALVPLETLASTTKEAFQSGENAETNPALSWGFVSFLLHGEKGRLAPGFRAYLAGLPVKRTPKDLEKALGRPLKSLQEPLQAWVRDVFVPAVQP